MKKFKQVCIIDDDPIYVFGTKRIMQLADFCESFLAFNNGQTALDNLTEIITKGELIPEVILLDINMPVMDGWQFLDEFIKIPSTTKIKIYLVSSSIHSEDIERAKHYSIVENYIIKPISVEELSKIIEE